jgi:hypothetical protein
VPPASATGAHRPPELPGDCDDVPVDSDGVPEELGDSVGLVGDELGGPELADVELGAADVGVTRDVTANGSTAMTALLAAAG